MKVVLILILTFYSGVVTAQTWQTIPKELTGYTSGATQFLIDPYTNNIWINMSQWVAVIENDGTIKVITDATGELGVMSGNLSFAFTPNHVYCIRDGYGLRSFDNYITQQEYSFNDCNGVLSTNEDTVFMLQVEIGGNPQWVRFVDGALTIENRVASHVIAKNGFEYADRSSLVHYTLGSQYDNISTSDPEYLWSGINDMKFTRLTDTCYVSGLLGINKIYNYDVFDTITPNNTTNMPSPNVLEMEFDLQDNLWAVFGDGSDNPFAIARLDGDNWVDLINSGNSPLYFTEFHGLEIDTLGNLWFSDKNAIHTIVTASSPTWLSTPEYETHDFKVYPNPSNGELTIDLPDSNGESYNVALISISGVELETFKMDASSKSLDLKEYPSGIYFVQVALNGVVSRERIVLK